MIIETKDEFEIFLNSYKNNDVILIPVLADNVKNVLNNKLCLLFVKILNKSEYYILPFIHSEANNLKYDVLEYLSQTNNKKYVIDKKEFLNICPMSNIVDVNVLYYLNTNTVTEIQQKYSKAELFLLGKSNAENIGDVYVSVPLLKIQERLLEYANSIELIINTNIQAEKSDAFDFLNNRTIENLAEIEKNGIYVDSEVLLKYHPSYSAHINNNHIYSHYNIYTSTGRPSNRFANLNFSALNKDNGEREFIQTRFGDRGILFYFDYEAYHLNLIANLISFTFPKDISIHEYLGKQYFEKEELTSEDYDDSKGVSFQILYGGIHDTVAEAIPFFGQTQSFINDLWKNYNDDGYITTEISHKKIYKHNLNSMNKNKLFNYYLQNYETERNILMIEKINKLLKQYKTRLIMYLYDGFLFDYCLDDDKMPFVDIKIILESDGRFKTKQYMGKNFNNLIKIE